MPKLSAHFQNRKPSGIRVAQIEFANRNDKVEAINLAIGNVSLPAHPSMQKRLFSLDKSPFKDGVIKYTPTAGLQEANDAFRNIIRSSGFSTDGLHSMITTGGSQAMGLVVLGACGPAGTDESPLLLIDAAYTNYLSMAQRMGRRTVSIQRHLQDNGKFTLPDLAEIEKAIEKHKPGGMVIIPYDNPTGHFYDHKTFVKLAKLCVKYDLWLISDEAYRELHYVDHDTVSVWGLTEEEVPGITGRRVSIETASKIWNACGLRIGALISDDEKFIKAAVAENTAELSPPMIGQWLMGALAHEDHDDLQRWYQKQRDYYKKMMFAFTEEMKKELPGVIVSSPDASIYSVIDVRNISDGFDASDFVLWCAREGKVDIDGRERTLLVAPMAGFYNVEGENPGKTQMRIAYVESPDRMKLVPRLFAELFRRYVSLRGNDF